MQDASTSGLALVPKCGTFFVIRELGFWFKIKEMTRSGTFPSSATTPLPAKRLSGFSSARKPEAITDIWPEICYPPLRPTGRDLMLWTAPAPA